MKRPAVGTKLRIANSIGSPRYEMDVEIVGHIYGGPDEKVVLEDLGNPLSGRITRGWPLETNGVLLDVEVIG